MREEIYAAGRWVLVNRGTKSQTINIYSRAHVDGEYEWVLRIKQPDRFVNYRDLPSLDLESPEELVHHLMVEHGAVQERGRKAPYLR